MNTTIKITLSLAALVFATSLSAQKDKSYILKNTNVEELQRMAVEFEEKYRIEHGEAIRKALEMGWDTINLIRLGENGRPEYWVPTNNVAAAVTSTVSLRGELNVYGQNMVVGMWEANDDGNYAARQTHQDLTGRVTIFGGNTNPSSHATHVAGTLIGNPPVSAGDDSKGMAPQATLKSYGLTNVFGNMATEAAAGMLVSNHSYGIPGGWKREESLICFPFSSWSRFTWLGGSANFNSTGDDPSFGAYGSASEDYDDICTVAPFYLPVFAAGNFNDENPEQGTFCDDEVRDGASGVYVNYDPALHPPGNAFQKSTISAYGNAKNIMTVGNLQDDGVTINASSSRGQTDDGRIKPDIYGNGTELYSAESSANNAYDYKTGTSMASPNVAGSLLLLQEAYENLNGNIGRYMRSATLKGLALHTAVDLGNAGPDYTYGWGRLNAYTAGRLLKQDAWANGFSNATVIEDVITSASQTWVYEVNLEGVFTSGLGWVTLAYTDVAGSSLVNDLDLKLVRISDGAEFLPFILNPNNPNSPATVGDNDIDNVERVNYISPTPERFEVRITVEGSLQNNAPQPFSLIISGLDSGCHANIRHKTIQPDSGTYTAELGISSEATIIPGRDVTYQSNGKIILKPGFRAQQQTGTGAGFFKTATGTCN